MSDVVFAIVKQNVRHSNFIWHKLFELCSRLHVRVFLHDASRLQTACNRVAWQHTQTYTLGEVINRLLKQNKIKQITDMDKIVLIGPSDCYFDSFSIKCEALICNLFAKYLLI